MTQDDAIRILDTHRTMAFSTVRPDWMAADDDCRLRECRLAYLFPDFSLEPEIREHLTGKPCLDRDRRGAEGLVGTQRDLRWSARFRGRGCRGA